MAQTLRDLGMTLALARSATETGRAISEGKCYEEIFKIAVEEIGRAAVIEAVVDSKNSWIARHALIHVAEDANDVAQLVETLIAGGGECAANALIWSMKPPLPLPVYAKIADALKVSEYPQSARRPTFV